MHSSDFNYYSSYFAPTLTPLQPSRSSLGSLGSARMTGSPYPAAAPLHSTPSSRLGLGHFSPLDSYRTHSQQSPLRQASLGYSSDASATSAESPPSSSSANESPLPDPLIDNMDHDISAQVATGNDDYYPYVSDDMAAVGYPYGHHGSRPFPLPGYVVDPPDLYKQPVAAPLPLNLSLAMSYSWSPEAKKFQPLYPSLQQIQRQALDASQTSAQPSAVAPTHAASRPSCASSQPFGQEIEDINLVYPPQAAPRSYPSPPSQPQSSLTGYPQLRQSISVKQENDMRFPDLYNESAEVANCNSGMEVFGALFDTGSPPVESSSTLDLAMRYAQTPAQPPVTQSSMTMPMLSAPVPRHSAYFGSSLVSSCERTCQEQEQEPDIQVLRVQTQGLQEQRTVRPAEVSPVMGFAGLPEAGDDDAEGEPDIEPFSLHDGKPDDGHRVARFHPARAEGVLDYVNRSGGAGASHRGHDFGVHQAVEGVDEFDEYDDRDLDNEYKVEEREDHDDDDGDGDFVPHRRATSKNTRSLRPRSVAGKNSVRYNPYGTDVSPSAVKRSSKSPLISASDLSPTLSSGQSGKLRKNARTLPVPIPVPNLTKKSRGRRVPTVHAVNNGGRGQRDVALGARIYLCDVSGCGKCFARGEHLKRHIRSIHTYEKPHKCPYPGCGKEFSRHDNLGQHMKVHKDYSKVLERMESGEV